jgi:hypothetical protein
MNRLAEKNWNNPIHNNLKKLKYLGINLTQEMKDLYNEN